MKPVGFNKKKLIVLCIAGFFLIVGGVFKLLTNYEISKLPGENVAKIWSPDGGYTHISAYFTPDAGLEADTLKYLHYQIEQKLKTESIEPDPENENARLIANSFFAEGKLSAESDIGKTSLNAVGVWGDFFLIHKPNLLTGGYFSDDSLNNDYCLLDEEAAWALFGSNDIVGLTIYVGNRPLIVKGVFRQPQDKLATVCGAVPVSCYVSYDFLKENGTINNISAFDIVLPNPVPDYGMKKVSEALALDESKVEYVENTKRFGVINAVKNLKGIKLRGIRTKALVYPWWENETRVKGDKISVFSFVFVSGIIIAAAIVLVLAVILFIQNKDIIAYNFVSLYERIRDYFYKKQIEKKRGDL